MSIRIFLGIGAMVALRRRKLPIEDDAGLEAFDLLAGCAVRPRLAAPSIGSRQRCSLVDCQEVIPEQDSKGDGPDEQVGMRILLYDRIPAVAHRYHLPVRSFSMNGRGK